jgi:hypothetical protein
MAKKRKAPRCDVIVKPLAGYSGGRCALPIGHAYPHRSSESTRAHQANSHQYNMKTRYGITPDEYLLIKEAQGGKCYLCQIATGKAKRLSVDHEHSHHDEKKKGCPDCIRGLLCHRCNRALGWVEWIGLTRIAGYLTDPPARPILKSRATEYQNSAIEEGEAQEVGPPQSD